MRNLLEQLPAPSRAARRIVLRARQCGQRYQLWMALIHGHIDTHGEPWRLRMRAPEHQPRTLLARLVDLWRDAPSCGGSCDQGRRPCDCYILPLHPDARD